MADMENLFKGAKERLFAGTGVAVGRAPGPIDTESTGIVIKEPSFWEKATNQAGESAFMRGFAGFAGAAGEGVSGVADRVMGENEQAEAFALLREQMPQFNQEAFLEHVKSTMAPEVLGAYLKGEVDPVKLHCREQALAQLQALMNERNERNLLMDPRLLHMGEVELEGIRIIGGNPTPVVSFETHQLHCIRSRATAAIVEGDEDDIRSVHYLWALQQREDLTEETPEAERWQVTELAVRGMMSTY